MSPYMTGVAIKTPRQTVSNQAVNVVETRIIDYIKKRKDTVSLQSIHLNVVGNHRAKEAALKNLVARKELLKEVISRNYFYTLIN